MITLYWVRYRYKADNPLFVLKHGESSPRKLVQWMARHFRTVVIDVLKVWEETHGA